jgi:hypothetical protein
MSNTSRAIYVPGIDRWVSIKSYVAAVKTAKANPDVEFSCGLTCWWPCTGHEIMEQFRDGINERISAGVPYSQRGVTA